MMYPSPTDFPLDVVLTALWSTPSCGALDVDILKSLQPNCRIDGGVAFIAKERSDVRICAYLSFLS